MNFADVVNAALKQNNQSLRVTGVAEGTGVPTSTIRLLTSGELSVLCNCDDGSIQTVFLNLERMTAEV